MKGIHRLVIVLAFWGALPAIGLIATQTPEAQSAMLWLIVAPGILAALIIYPIAWICADR